jgi:uncharacterized protein (TIGR02246 family)
MISTGLCALTVSRSTWLFALLLLAPSALEAQSQTKEDAAQVKQVITDFAAAWDRHDVEAMVALHTVDVNFTNIFGIWNKGHAEVQAILQHGHGAGGIFTQSKMKIYDQQVSFLAPNVAVVHNNMELLDSPPSTMGLCHSIRVLVKTNRKWLIRDFQNTAIKTDPALRPK